MLIREATFVVVDTETTGTNAETDRLLEVAAVKVWGGQIVDQFAQLINPQRSVPRRITRLTGITTAMVFDEPPAAEVLPGFLAFLGDGVLVAHNLPFDLGFLNAELRRAGLDPCVSCKKDRPGKSWPTVCISCKKDRPLVCRLLSALGVVIQWCIVPIQESLSSDV